MDCKCNVWNVQENIRLNQTQKSNLIPLRKREKEKESDIFMRMSIFCLIPLEEQVSERAKSIWIRFCTCAPNGADWRGSTAFPKCIINFVFSKLNFMKRIGIMFFSSFDSYDDKKKTESSFSCGVAIIMGCSLIHIFASTSHSTLLISILLYRTRSICVHTLLSLIDCCSKNVWRWLISFHSILWMRFFYVGFCFAHSFSMVEIYSRFDQFVWEKVKKNLHFGQ